MVLCVRLVRIILLDEVVEHFFWWGCAACCWNLWPVSSGQLACDLVLTCKRCDLSAAHVGSVGYIWFVCVL